MKVSIFVTFVEFTILKGIKEMVTRQWYNFDFINPQKCKIGNMKFGLSSFFLGSKTIHKKRT